jgi:hypothetical protein
MVNEICLKVPLFLSFSFYPLSPLPSAHLAISTNLLHNNRPSNRRNSSHRRRLNRARRRGNRRSGRSLRNETATRTRNFLGSVESQRDVDAAWQGQVDVELALDGEFFRARDVVEGVGGHGVVVCVVGAGSDG